MSWKNCCVRDCPNGTRTGEKLYSFPSFHKDKERFLQWFAAASNPRLCHVLPKSMGFRYICKVHFEERFLLCTKLTRSAVPTLNLPEAMPVIYNGFKGPQDSLPGSRNKPDRIDVPFPATENLAVSIENGLNTSQQMPQNHEGASERKPKTPPLQVNIDEKEDINFNGGVGDLEESHSSITTCETVVEDMTINESNAIASVRLSDSTTCNVSTVVPRKQNQEVEHEHVLGPLPDFAEIAAAREYSFGPHKDCLGKINRLERILKRNDKVIKILKLQHEKHRKGLEERISVLQREVIFLREKMQKTLENNVTKKK